MKLPYRDRLFSGAVVVVLTAVLVALAVVQYRWSNEVSRATSERMEVDLETTMMRWREDVYHEVAGFCFRLQVDPTAGSRARLKQYIQQYNSWARTASHAAVVKNVFILDYTGGDNPALLQLNAAHDEFHRAEWPAGFEQLRQRVQSINADLAVAATHLKSADELRQTSHSKKSGGSRQDLREMAKQFPVMIDQDLPALVQPVYRRLAGDTSRADPTAVDWVVLELDSQVLREHILRELLERYFNLGEGKTATYDVAVVGGVNQRQVIYSSSPNFPGHGGAEPDEKIRVFGPALGPNLRGIDMILLPAFHTQSADGRFHESGDEQAAWPLRIEPIHYSPEDDEWYLIARHRMGSLEAAVSGMRKRNLAVSFAALLILAASMLIMHASSRRAKTLARLQMDFVAAVSHELRTPLAVICSAADNIADGVVEDKSRLEQYGGAIRNSARQLISLIEQVLTFSATRNNRYRYNFAPLDVADIVETACANTASIIRDAGVTLECKVDLDLPIVMGDRAALAHSLQNLITNAVKYGGPQRWVSILSSVGQDERGGREVQIAVEDKGPGIAPQDLRRIFEPFYRSESVVAAQIRGTGLGLALAKSIAEAMGGRLTVSSEPGQGSRFVLHLPAAGQAETASEVRLKTAESS